MADIIFDAVVARVQTLADGGIRVTLDLPESAVMQAAQMMECKRFGAVLEVTATAKVNTKNGHGTDKPGKIHI